MRRQGCELLVVAGDWKGRGEVDLLKSECFGTSCIGCSIEAGEISPHPTLSTRPLLLIFSGGDSTNLCSVIYSPCS